MPVSLTSEQVWREMEKQLFAVLGTVNAAGKPRTVGIVYKVKNKKIYILTSADSVKVRNIKQSPFASLTVTIPKRIPFMPWIQIPAATITFHGSAICQSRTEADAEMFKALTGGVQLDEAELDDLCLIEITPQGDFVTYGIGIALMKMAKPELARGRAPVE